MTRMLQVRRHKAVTILLYHDCIGLVDWNNLAASLIISTRLLQVVHSLFQTCRQDDNLGQAVRRQLVDGLLADLLHT